jgi:hypothetical protein
MIDNDLRRVEETATKFTYIDWVLGLSDVKIRVRTVLLSLVLAPTIIKKMKHSNQSKLITHLI